MINKIIKLSKNKSKEEIEKLEKEVKNLKDARTIFMYAYYFQSRALNVLDDLLDTSDYKYIHYFFRSIKDIDEEKCFNKLLESDNKTIFYSLYDRKSINPKFYIQALKKMEENGIDKYYYLTYYFYFIIRKEFNSEILELLIRFNGDVTKDNYKEKITELFNSTKTKVEYNNIECKNKYIGHDKFIPDMIVCHISFDYGEIIKKFYTAGSDVSTHYAISRNGDFKQFVDLKDSAWGNGTSKTNKKDVYYGFSLNKNIENRKTNANYYTYSIEHESIDGSLTDIQYKTSIKLMCKIIDYIKYTYGKNFKIDKEHIIGHHDVVPITRVSCPGDLFPIDNIISDLKKIYNNRKKNIDYEMLVNKKNLLDEDYFPGDLVKVVNRKGDNPNAILLLDRKVYQNFKILQKDALKDGFDIICDSAYRSFEYQQSLIDRAIKNNESTDFIAPKYASEHHTGLCLDIAAIIDGKYTDENSKLKYVYKWIEENAYKYGFILRYPKDKENITGYPYEPWHIRYVGKRISKIIQKENITLEEYYIKYKNVI